MTSNRSLANISHNERFAFFFFLDGTYYIILVVLPVFLGGGLLFAVVCSLVLNKGDKKAVDNKFP